MQKPKIAIARGDGIGPEIMDATLRILAAANASLDTHFVEIGEKVYLSGEKTGISQETWQTLKSCKAFLKGPITTPQGGGFKSLNVTIRTHMGLYANIRPCVSYAPFIETKHPGQDVIIIRENEEDLYVGIEYQQTLDVSHALKLISKQGSERIIRYAFEYARAYGRKKVTCFTKDNILKFSDGLFHKVFKNIATDYPDLENEHWIVDIGAAKLADTPDAFDVIVLPNLYGDILSDVAAQIAGSVGLAGSANIGFNWAMFEAIHGSAPRRANQNLANPSGLLHAAILMLVHLGQNSVASTIHNGWLCTLEEGFCTYDTYKESPNQKKLGTKEFADQVIAHLGKTPSTLAKANYQGSPKNLHTPSIEQRKTHQKRLLVVDIFVEYTKPLVQLVQILSPKLPKTCKLEFIANRGELVWPNNSDEIHLSDQFRLRISLSSHQEIINLLQLLTSHHIDFLHIENLYEIDGEKNFSLNHLFI